MRASSIEFQAQSVLSQLHHAMWICIGLGANIVIAQTPTFAAGITVTGNVVLDQPVSATGEPGISALDESNAQSLSIATRSGAFVTSSDNAAISALWNGSVMINVGATTSGFTNGVDVYSLAGNVTVTGTGDFVSTSFSTDWSGGYGIYAQSAQGSIAITGTGKTISAGTGIAAIIESGEGKISIARNGEIRADTGAGIKAFNLGNGDIAITTWSGGMIASPNGTALDTYAQAGATKLEIGADISGSTAIHALADGTGDITIESAQTVHITGTGTTPAIHAFSRGGHIDIGGPQGLGGPVAGGIFAQTSDDGAIRIHVDADVSNSSGIAIASAAQSGATHMTISNAAMIAGSTAAIMTSTVNGDVTIDNHGTVIGNLFTGYSDIGTGRFSFNNSGTLVLRDSDRNSGFAITNQSGGIITGTGVFGDISAEAGSLIQAGNRNSTGLQDTPQMGVFSASNVSLATGATVDIRADASGVSDRIAIANSASLGDARLNITATPQIESAWSEDKKFTVLTADHITGTFSDVTTDYAFLKFDPVYSDHSVSVTSTRNDARFHQFAETANQISVANDFDTHDAQAASAPVKQSLILTRSEVPAALTQLSGAGIAVMRTGSLMTNGAFITLINSESGKFTPGATESGSNSNPSRNMLFYRSSDKRHNAAFDRLVSYPKPDPQSRIWAQILGGFSDLRADRVTGSPSQYASTYGLVGGADAAVTPDLRSGFALAVGQAFGDAPSVQTHTEAIWGQSALYAVLKRDNSYVQGTVTYGYFANQSERVVTSFGTYDKATGQFGSHLFSTRIEAGQTFNVSPMVLTPFLAFEPSWHMTNAYEETGPARVTLGYDQALSRAMPVTLGVKFDASYRIGDFKMTPSAALSWIHDFNSVAQFSSHFTALPDSHFAVEGARGDRDMVRAEIRLEAMPIETETIFYLDGRSDVGERTTYLRGTAGLRLAF